MLKKVGQDGKIKDTGLATGAQSLGWYRAF